MGWLAGLLCVFWGALLSAGANYAHSKNNVPRLKFSYKEMLESSNVISFHGLANSSSYHTFLLDEERGRLYVGAKDHIFSFNLVNIKDFQKIVWPVSYTRRDECKWAGKDILKECANFIKVLKAYNQTHLYACGTGAFHPICTYIEVGHHPENTAMYKVPQKPQGRRIPGIGWSPKGQGWGSFWPVRREYRARYREGWTLACRD